MPALPMTAVPMTSVPTSSEPAGSLPDLLRMAAADSAALARLVELEQERMRSWLVHVLRDEDLAADALQETWLILSRGQWRFVVHSSDGDGDVRAWLRQIALRAALRLRERANTHRRILGLWRAREPEPRPVTTPLEQLEENDRGVVVWAAVADLPSTQREALELRFRDGLDFAAIGRVQGCSALTARVRTWRGLSEVRRRLGVLGLLALPGLVRAALGVGGWSAVSSAPVSGFSAGFTGLDPRLLAGASVATVGLIALGAAWFASSDRDLGAQPPIVMGKAEATSASASTSALSTTGVERPAWEWIPPPAADSTSTGVPAVSGVPHSETATSQVLYDIVLFKANDLRIPTDRCSILGAEQRTQLLSRLKDEQDDSLLSAPKVLARSGEQAEIQVAQQRPFVAGYQRRNEGVEPVQLIANDGIRVQVSGRAEDGYVLLTRATAQADKILGMTDHHAAWTDGSGRDQMLTWQEVTMLSSFTANLPSDGVWLAEGSSLLLPVQSGKVVRTTPGGAVPQAGTGDAGCWVLITPSVVADDAPPSVPPSSAASETPPVTIPSATG